MAASASESLTPEAFPAPPAPPSPDPPGLARKTSRRSESFPLSKVTVTFWPAWTGSANQSASACEAFSLAVTSPFTVTPGPMSVALSGLSFGSPSDWPASWASAPGTNTLASRTAIATATTRLCDRSKIISGRTSGPSDLISSVVLSDRWVVVLGSSWLLPVPAR
jgi:hypothetical protein